MRTYGELKKKVLILIMGAPECGKTELFTAIGPREKGNKKKKFSENRGATIGIDFSIKRYTPEEKVPPLHFWDTSGQSKFRTIVNTYLRGVNLVLLCIDLSLPSEDFSAEIDRLKNLMGDEIKQHAPNAQIIFVGTKDDGTGATLRNSNFEILKREAEACACLCYRTSAKEDTGIDELETELKKIELTPAAAPPPQAPPPADLPPISNNGRKSRPPLLQTIDQLGLTKSQKRIVQECWDSPTPSNVAQLQGLIQKLKTQKNVAIALTILLGVILALSLVSVVGLTGGDNFAPLTKFLADTLWITSDHTKAAISTLAVSGACTAATGLFGVVRSKTVEALEEIKSRDPDAPPVGEITLDP